VLTELLGVEIEASPVLGSLGAEVVDDLACEVRRFDESSIAADSKKAERVNI
jgi:hypothetical protein